MKLVEFRITNYRSINDSGPVEVRDRTSLVGRNESGKSNLLLALKSLNPPDGLKALSKVKDFPRDRRIEEFTEQLPVVESLWELSDQEQRHLSETWPRARGVKKVRIGRPYAAMRHVQFENLPSLALDGKRAQKSAKALSNYADERIKQLTQAVSAESDPTTWAKNVSKHVQAVKTAGLELNGGTQAVEDLALLSEEIVQDASCQKSAVAWIEKALPIFFYLDEYPELNGHQDIEALAARKSQNQLEEADRNFLKLVKVAGLDVDELRKLLQQGNHEQRQQMANRAGAVVTKKLRELWKDRPLMVRFNLDANHFDTLVSDPNASYAVEVNLNERSRGLRWFFAFYITFAADTEQGGRAGNAILLLDEPGLYLHAVAQEDLLRHFAQDFKNQIVYTTHSPFMIPVGDLPSIRTVNIEQDKGTTVSNDPVGDAKTLFPIQTALGYHLTQTMFIGNKTLVVEGVTDHWYLTAMSEYLKGLGRSGLPDGFVVTPAGGANKVSYMVALLASQGLHVLVLLDADRQAEMAKADLLKSKLARQDAIVTVNDGFSNPAVEADTEDLLDPGVYEALAREAYATELKGKTLVFNASIPRIVKRMEEAFKGVGLEFHKTRPASLFLRRIGEKPEAVLTADSQERFVKLFSIISKRFNQQHAADRVPFR